MSIDLFWKYAGFVTFHWGDYALHLGVLPSHWYWGRDFEEYEHCLDYWGAGPLFLLVRCNIPDHE